ncbi:glycoside hydrolase family 31 protein [Streptomyces qinzhouensis]|uniref:Glycoside hydrolase family 31 protein n=1 Tax=Streptomyces qinzhouensis TaxID=2599401 RepID=A0A5B8J5U0_9ACTN|nr:glycoside hydrolase family 31 protein [Streptomyces qinzhouensis]QDY75784.1 glycoside hydrolase family 31 protein [Streptomyces qinzhouensis]
MNGRELVCSVRSLHRLRGLGARRGLRAVRWAWRRRRTDAWGLPPRGAERARVPGAVSGAEALPGGGVVRFARAELRIRIAAGGAVFWGWDGAGPEPSYALAGPVPEADPRAGLEPDTGGGWRVVSRRVTVAVSRYGAVEVRTPGGVVLRRDLPPRWWEPVGGGPARWLLDTEVAADARFFGLGGRGSGPRLRDGRYRLWNGAVGPDGVPSSVTMPVQMVVADAGTHLVFHDTTWDGRVTLREGTEGGGSGHDRPGTAALRMEGGPLRCWVVVGTPAGVLARWSRLVGPAAVPPSWALGVQHTGGGGAELRRVVAGYRERGLPLSAVHLNGGEGWFPGLPEAAREVRAAGVRLVSVVDPAVRAERGDPVYEEGRRLGAFVRDGRGRELRGGPWSGAYVYPDVTDPAVRRWWGDRCAERSAEVFSGVVLTGNEPAGGGPFGESALPGSARHVLDGRGGDHREARNVYGSAAARAGYEGLRRFRPGERPFLLSRAGWAGMQRYGGAWPGGAGDDWPGLRAALSLVLGLGLCGVPFAGAGGGGGGEGRVSPEWYLRRLQLAAYLPLFLTGGGREPWEFGPVVLDRARAVLRERERLRPYLVTLAQVARLTGSPYVRPVWWGAPEDRALRECGDAFLLGDALLVAPVLEPGVERRAVRLPRGRWYDTATGRAYEGPGRVVVEAPLSRIPVLARGGSVVPVRGADGGVELEVWAPAAGRKGGGLVVPDPGDGWARAEVERYAVRSADGRVVVKQVRGDGVVAPVRPVRVRGTGYGEL